MYSRPFGTSPSSVLFPTLNRWAILVMSLRDKAPVNFRKALGLEPRLPTTDDLLLLYRRLNEAGAKYLVLASLLKQRGEWP